MVYKKRELRRLWGVDIYVGDRDDPKTKTRIEGVVAWSQVDAIRHAGGHVVSQPKPICFVTWPDFDGGPIFEIKSPKIGPIGDPIKSRIGGQKMPGKPSPKPVVKPEVVEDDA